jgi:hypothetical protein
MTLLIVWSYSHITDTSEPSQEIVTSFIELIKGNQYNVDMSHITVLFFRNACKFSFIIASHLHFAFSCVELDHLHMVAWLCIKSYPLGLPSIQKQNDMIAMCTVLTLG